MFNVNSQRLFDIYIRVETRARLYGMALNERIAKIAQL